MYSGLALYGLRRASETLAEINTDQTASPTPESESSVFVDPSRAKIASIRKAGLWAAVHGDTSNPKDARYGFGWSAVEKRSADGTWEEAIPHRPMTRSGINAGGPVILTKSGRRMVPRGTSIKADSSGAAKVNTGWAKNPNHSATVNRGTTLTYKVESDKKLSMSFVPKNNRKYQFQFWYPKGSRVFRTSRGIVVTEPDGDKVSYLFNRPTGVRSSKNTDHSAYDKNLRSSLLTVNGKAGKQLKQTTIIGG